MEIYLDNAATTRTDDCVVDLMARVMREDYGNPSSKHGKGVEAENYLKETRKILASILKVQEKEILFTSGGTESNNTALLGAAMTYWRRGKHIIVTCFEHPSVLEPLKYLEQYVCPDGEHFEIQYLSVDRDGHIDTEELARSIRPDTILVTTMFVNNEIGAVQDISRIGQIVKAMNPECLYHVDAIQAFGKYSIFPKRMHIDMLSVSGHKIHGPKGVGFLYIRDQVRLKPLILGGGQQKGMRSGTDNVPGVAGLGRAAYNAYLELESNVSYLISLKDRMIDGLERYAMELAAAEDLCDTVNGISMSGAENQADTSNRSNKANGVITENSANTTMALNDVKATNPGKIACSNDRKSGRKKGKETGYILVNSRKGTEGAPHIVSVTFFPVKSEVMLHALEEKGICVSSGSACSSNKPGLSGTLQSIGLSAKEADCTIRFSFSKYNSEEEIDETLQAIRELYSRLRIFVSH